MKPTKLSKTAKTLLANMLELNEALSYTELRALSASADTTSELFDLVLHSAYALTDSQRTSYNKLVRELEAIDYDLVDLNVACENMDSQWNEGCVTYYAELARHLIDVAVCTAEQKGIDLNARLGRVVY